MLALVFLSTSCLATGYPALQPFQLRDDFQANTLSQWASYPPVQDVGYDPSLTPTSEYGAIGGRSLMRVVRPASSSRLRFGFIKRLTAVANGEVDVSFSYRLGVSEKAVLEVGLAGSDGHLFRRQFLGEAQHWAQIRFRVRDIPNFTNLDAIFITATYPRANTDTEYRFLLDDVVISAAQNARFDFESPSATTLPPWRSLVASSSYSVGQRLAIHVKAPLKLTKVECVLKDPDGHSVAAKRLREEQGRWSDNTGHSFRALDPPGVWHAEVYGVAADGSELRTDLRFLVWPENLGSHPRLYFLADDRPALVARTRASGLVDVWDHLTSLAAASRNTANLADGTRTFALLDAQFLLPTLPGYFDLLTKASDRILYNTLRSYIAGDHEAFRSARSALLAVAGWKTWTPPWFPAHGQSTYYPVGELTTVVAFVYHLLFPDLSATERDTVAGALLERGVKPAYDEYVLDNRIMANTSNWIGHTVGGGIIDALALLRDRESPMLTTYLGGLLMKFEDHLAASYLSDGSYGEGISYQEFDLKTTTLALTALKRVCGISYWEKTPVKESLWYPLYALADPIQSSMDMGDSHPPSGYSIAQVVQQSDQPAMGWYYDKFKHLSINDFLFPPSRLPGKLPSLPHSRIFAQKGNAVLRTGWASDDATLLFRAGPNFNHNHADQGSFLLRALGETLVTEGGYSDYYKDPYYSTYFSQAPGHNTILVNGDSASQEIADVWYF